MLGLKKPDRSERDVEMVLRVFSLFERWEQYEAPMLHYLNEAQNRNKSFNSERAIRFRDRFPKAVRLLSESVEKPFQPNVRVNTAVMDSVMVAVMEDESLSAKQLTDNYPMLLEDEAYQENIVGGTADKTKLLTRIRRAKEILGA